MHMTVSVTRVYTLSYRPYCCDFGGLRFGAMLSGLSPLVMLVKFARHGTFISLPLFQISHRSLGRCMSPPSSCQLSADIVMSSMLAMLSLLGQNGAHSLRKPVYRRLL